MRFTIQALIAGTWVINSGCGSSSFSGSSASKATPPVKPQEAQAESADAAPSAPGNDVGAAAAPAPLPEVPSVVDLGDCAGKTPALNYNIIMAFDNTGSQAFTDPLNIRGAGGQAFVDQFSTYIAANSKAVVNMNVLSFNAVSNRSAHGWQTLTADHAALIKADIATATANPIGSTAYSPALNDAAALFTEINSKTAGTEARNYLIFLTDGLPNADNPIAINQAVKNVVATDAAIIAVASGDVNFAGEVVVRALGQPATGAKHPDLVGQYYRAASADDLKTVWGSLTAKISSACNAAGT